MKVVLIIVAVVIGIVMLTGASSCAETAAKQDQVDKDPSAWNTIAIGDSMSEVQNIMGDPSDKQAFDNAGIGHTECWYWGYSYQICFDNAGHVDGKNSY
jgi:hypothetical protein